MSCMLVFFMYDIKYIITGVSVQKLNVGLFYEQENDFLHGKCTQIWVREIRGYICVIYITPACFKNL